MNEIRDDQDSFDEDEESMSQLPESSTLSALRKWSATHNITRRALNDLLPILREINKLRLEKFLHFRTQLRKFAIDVRR